MAQHDERVASAVRAELARRRVSQVAFADKLGLGRGAMWRRLDGQVPFRVSELTAAAEFLGVPLETLLANTTDSTVSA